MEPVQPRLSFQAYPPVIKWTLILCGLAYFIDQMNPGYFIRWLALWPINSPDVWLTSMGMKRVPDFYIWQLLTTAILHGGLGHLFFNMFALWMFGVQIENIWGSRRFLIFFAVSVMGASLVQLFVVSWSVAQGAMPIPTVGASGGVFGVLMAFAWMFPNHKIVLLIPPIPIKAKWFVLIYAGIELFLGVTGTQSGVAHFAHLGGLVFGFLLIQYWRGKLLLKPDQTFYW